VDLGLVPPKIWRQPTLNLKMIQLQFDDSNVFGKVAPDIFYSHMQSGHSEAFALRFDDHTYLLLSIG